MGGAFVPWLVVLIGDVGVVVFGAGTGYMCPGMGIGDVGLLVGLVLKVPPVLVLSGTVPCCSGSIFYCATTWSRVEILASREAIWVF